MIIPLLSVILSENLSTENIFINFTNDFLTFFSIEKSLLSILMIYFLIITLQLTFTFVSSIYQSKVINNFSYKIRKIFFNSIIDSTWNFILKKEIEEHSNQILNESNRTAACLRIFFLAFKALFLVMFYTIIAFLNSPSLLFFVAIVALVMFIISIPLGKKSKQIGKKITLINENLLSQIQNSLINFKIIKIFNNQFFFKDKLKKSFINDKDIYVQADFIQNLTTYLLSIWGVVSICIIIWISQSVFKTDSIILIVTLYLYLRIYNQLIDLYQNINSFIMSFEGYVNLQNEQIIADRNKERLKNKNTKFLSNEVSIEFKNIFLSYGSQEVHKNLSFKIQKKEFVGIFGPSGSGKSTIVDLICGLLSPQKGKILINGFDIDNINIKKWRESIGYITQSVYLIDGSIKENISFNRENISNDKILNVLKLVGADLFVNKKEKKLSTKINLRTSNLSGGEKQRIGIARGLLGDKSLLIFDEPTSSLDSVNEKKIISIIKKLKGKKTIILISHDLKVMKFCDKIIKI